MLLEELIAGPLVRSVLDEVERSGLALDVLPGNTGKLRLMLDLAATLRGERRLRVLDVGCAGGPWPLNVWDAFVPLADRFDLAAVDIDGIAATKRRASEIGLEVDARRVGAYELVDTFGRGAFDAVVSTQVLEHLRDWPRALREMGGVLRPGGTLYVTCDSGAAASGAGGRARRAAKRRYALLVERAPALRRAARRLLSGEWELAPAPDELRAEAVAAGLKVERLAPYAHRAVKHAQRTSGSATRILSLALEEALAAETAGEVDLPLYAILYLRARRSETVRGGTHGSPA